MADAMPKQLGKYSLIEPLRAGGEAEVWKAMDNTTGKMVAIRILKKKHVDTDDVRRHFEKEVKKLQLLDGHRHIISLLDSSWDHAYPYLVMPFIPNGCLWDQLQALPEQKRRLPFEEALISIRQTADALTHAHEHKIIHRDVKPSNLLRGSDGILLSDFGIALDAEATHPITREYVVSLLYCAPEQLAGHPVFASDQYALAVTGCELITGKRPRDEGLKTLREMHPKIAEVFTCALADEPAKRFPSMEAFATALDQAALSEILSEYTKPSLPILPPSPPPPPPKRFPWSRLAVAVAYVLLLLSASLGAWTLRGVVDGPPKPTPTRASGVPPACSRTITTVNDSGPGSLPQALQDVPQKQNCLLSFASSVRGDLVLAKPLTIDQNVIIEAQDQNQVTITPQTPQVAITIGAGYTVSFQNLSFTGLGVTKSAQPDAFIQMNSANVTFVNCDLSNFYSDGDGSALSNKYGHLTLEDTTLKNNTSTDNGGAISNLGITSTGQGTLTLNGSTLSGNVANYGGGGIYNLGGYK